MINCLIAKYSIEFDLDAVPEPSKTTWAEGYGEIRVTSCYTKYTQ